MGDGTATALRARRAYAACSRPLLRPSGAEWLKRPPAMTPTFAGMRSARSPKGDVARRQVANVVVSRLLLLAGTLGLHRRLDGPRELAFHERAKARLRVIDISRLGSAARSSASYQSRDRANGDRSRGCERRNSQSATCAP
jgi:hypothetical protein